MGREGAAVLAGLLALAACARDDASAPTTSATATATSATTTTVTATDLVASLPAESPCTDVIAVSPRRSDGGHYRPGAPAKDTLLEPGVSGARLIISGYVLFPDCRPVPGAVLDVWQADAEGRYDDTGWQLRGVLRSDEAGRYAIETIVPGGVDGAEPVVHIKASEAPGGRVLTTAVPITEAAVRFDVVIEVG